MTVPTMMTLKEASAQTGLSYDYLRKMCVTGQIVHIRAGCKILINMDRLIEFLNTAGRKEDCK